MSNVDFTSHYQKAKPRANKMTSASLTDHYCILFAAGALNDRALFLKQNYFEYLPLMKVKSLSSLYALPYAFTMAIIQSTIAQMPHVNHPKSNLHMPQAIWPLTNLSIPNPPRRKQNTHVWIFLSMVLIFVDVTVVLFSSIMLFLSLFYV